MFDRFTIDFPSIPIDVLDFRLMFDRCLPDPCFLVTLTLLTGWSKLRATHPHIPPGQARDRFSVDVRQGVVSVDVR